MSIKFIGAVLIVAGCAGVGFSMAAGCKREEWALRSLMGTLDFMTCQLHYRLTPLPELCRQAGQQNRGPVGQVMTALAEELDKQITPDADSCMHAALSRIAWVPKAAEEALRLLGKNLGRFDLAGQLRGLEQVRGHCQRSLEAITTDRDQRIRSYQTLGVCAGAALAILFV